MMSKKDLDAIMQSGYIKDGFSSLGIVSGTPVLKDGVICVNCDGIYSGDCIDIADRVAQLMGRKGWNVDVWFDVKENELKVAQKKKED